MPTSHEIFVGLGSNVNPRSNLRDTIGALTKHFGQVQCSSVYQSPALGFRGDDFLNMVVRISSIISAEEFESQLSRIERSGGRARSGARFVPRTIDLDLLLYGARVDARLRVPRDDVLAYPFVLAPLAEIAPHQIHPLTGTSMSAAWAAMLERAPPVLSRLGDSSILSLLSPADATSTVDS